jgi:putative acetyltransferase
VIVRQERLGDHSAARAVQTAAFAAGLMEPVEARLLDALRASDAWIPALSLVAEIEGRIVGHCVATRGHVGDVACVGLGPIGVLPEMQRRGAGSMLMSATIDAAELVGEPLIALLGDPAYYSRFGFDPATDHGIEPPDPAWGDHFQVLRLSAWTDSISGTFRYAAPFDDLE